MSDKLIRNGKEIKISKKCPCCGSSRFKKKIGEPIYLCSRCKYTWIGT